MTKTTPEDVRRTALTLPEVSEGTHFGLVSFKVRGRTFVTIQKGDTHAILHVDRDTADAAATRSPSTKEAVFRNDGRIFVGLRVDLTENAPSAVAGLVRSAWRNRAPKRLVVVHEAQGSSGGRTSEREG